MGRKKTLTKEELLAKAMAIFREYGFAGTSADMLVERTGVSRYSLYSDFGNKQGLFEAALELYNQTIIDARFGPLETQDAGLSDIQTLFDFYGAAGDGPAAGLGCLLCNTAVEFGPRAEIDALAVTRYLDRLKGAFTNALSNARREGALIMETEIASEADFLTSTTLGLFVLIRANAPAETIQSAAKTAREHVATLEI